MILPWIMLSQPYNVAIFDLFIEMGCFLYKITDVLLYLLYKIGGRIWKNDAIGLKMNGNGLISAN